MATEAKLRQLADKGCPVYYFYSSERYLVRQAVAATVRVLSADSDEDATILDGAAPELEQLIMAAGTISFFGTRRVVVLPEIDPAAYGSKDLDELCSTLSSLENAVAVLGSVFPLERGKLKLGKQAQKLQAQCKAIGYTEELAKPRPFELKNLMMERAKAQLENLQQQRDAAKTEAGKAFPQEAELREKSARLAELDASLNIDKSSKPDRKEHVAKKPSVLEQLKAPCRSGSTKRHRETEAR